MPNFVWKCMNRGNRTMIPYNEDTSGRLSSIHNDWPLSFLFFCVSQLTNGSTSNHFVLCAHMYFIGSEMWYKTKAICIQITEFQDICEFASHYGIVFSFFTETILCTVITDVASNILQFNILPSIIVLNSFQQCVEYIVSLCYNNIFLF